MAHKISKGSLKAQAQGARKSKVGGYRPGSGRPKGTGKYKEITRPIRVPQSLIPDIQSFLSFYVEGMEEQQQAMREQMAQGFQNVFQMAPQKSSRQFPLYATRVAAGFPSPADDYIEAKLDLNQYLVKHPAATFFVRVEGDSMIGAGIFPDDILVVDRALTPSDGKIVIAVVNGELTVKRLKKDTKCILLVAENERYRPIQVTEETQFSIWGVVTNVIHSV